MLRLVRFSQAVGNVPQTRAFSGMAPSCLPAWTDRGGQKQDWRSRKRVGAPSTEDLYGFHSVLGALREGRREMVELLVKTESSAKPEDRTSIDTALNLAEAAEIPIIRCGKEKLSQLSQGRPHQGLILRAHPLPFIPINSLTALGPAGECYAVKSSTELVKLTMWHTSPPVWLALDSVHDPQNLGAILRSAYFFGIDGIVVCTKNSAPLSSTASRASAGALELMSNVFTTTRMQEFLRISRMAGWNVLGPMPPSKGASGAKQLSVSKLSSLDAPTVLVFGNEGEGLRTNLIQMLSHRVTVPSTNPHRSQGMDSLNVSTTAAILLQRLTENRTLIE